jgi:hypothetical protein
MIESRHGHLLEAFQDLVPRPRARIALAFHRAVDFAAIGRDASEASKPRDGALLSPPSKRREGAEKNKSPEA